MDLEHLVLKVVDSSPQVSDSLSQATQKLTAYVKGKYTSLMDTYCDWLDKNGVSPNQVVNYRVAAGIGAGAFLASADHGVFLESLGITLLSLSFIHDAVDGHLARKTKQTSRAGETLDALGDKVKVYALLGILISTMDIPSPTVFYSIVASIICAGVLDIISQAMRDNNIEEVKKCLVSPLTASKREKNLNTKSIGAAIAAGKIKTAIIMSGITLGFAKDIPGFEFTDENSTLLLSSIIASCGFSIASLHTKLSQKKA